MIIYTISSLFIILSISIIIISRPLIIALYVLCLALSLSVLVSLLINSWFAIFIFLIYVGGILVIFIYFSSLSPNQFLGYKSLIWISFIIFFMWIIFFVIVNPPLITQTIINPYSILFPITILYFSPNLLILIALILILLLVLLAVVKITEATFGPIRPFSYAQSFTKISPSTKNY